MIRRVMAAAVLTLAVAFFAAPAGSAQTYTGVTPPAAGGVLGSSSVQTPLGQVLTSAGERTPVGQVLPTKVSSPAAVGADQAQVGGLALTGADVATLLFIAVPLVLLGAVITRGGRSRPSH